jgi:hypothetical protein
MKKKLDFSKLSLLATLAASSNIPLNFGPKQSAKNRPMFTSEEIDEIRALPRKERKKRVAELKEKYARNRMDLRTQTKLS